MHNETPLWRDIRISDTVVDCLFSGFASGIGMAAVLIIAGFIGGSSISATMARFSPRPDNSAVTGILAHLAISGMYGIIFGISWGSIIRVARMNPVMSTSILAGIAYGIFLWLVAQFVLLPSSGSSLQDLQPGLFFLSHLVYGLVLGWLFGRNR